MSRKRAYIYERVSTAKQEWGTGLEMQTADAERWCERNGVEVDRTLSLTDAGVSAFRGKNRAKGALRTFLDQVEAGAIERGSHLVVSNLDRLSREGAWDALPLLQQLINAGVVLVTTQSGKVYDREAMRTDPMAFFELSFVLHRAREESETKSRRLKSSWHIRRGDAKQTGTPLPGGAPTWLAWHSADPALDMRTSKRLQRGEWQVDEAKADTVRLIFRLYLSGKGTTSITDHLNEQNVPTFKPSGKRWWRTTVLEILRNPNVYGAVQPHEWQEDPDTGKRKRVPVGDPIEGAYPGVVSEADFRKAQLLGSTRAPKGPNRTRAERGLVKNVFAGLLRCSECGGNAFRLGRKPEKYSRILCNLQKERTSNCSFRSCNYQPVEEAFLREIDRLVSSADVPLGSPASNRLAGVEVQIEKVTEELRTLTEAMLVARSPVGPSSPLIDKD